MNRINIYFDCEFTGLHQNTTLISIGLIADGGDTFYAEFDDYDKSQCNDWINKNVIGNLQLNGKSFPKSNKFTGNTKKIKEELTKWLGQYSSIEIWSDCLSYDWVLFNNLLADYSSGYPQLPLAINYIPFDICTLFKIKGIDPNISREEFIKEELGNKTIKKHNALFDARIIKMCHEKLIFKF